MKPVFVMVKCELGKAYEVAESISEEIEEVSEVYSISGTYDLLVKFYLTEGQDLGRFVNESLHSQAHIKDTLTVVTFNVF